MSDLVIIENGDLWVSSFEMSRGFETEHRSVKKLIERYEKDLEDVGEVPILKKEMERHMAFKISKVPLQKMGRPVVEYFLNEPQATFLTTLLRNNKVVVSFKKHLSKEFFRLRKILTKIISQKQNAEWLEKRESGKLERRIETDAIKVFIDYAKKQGSGSAEKYYMAISKMENNTLFHMELLKQKYPNLRNIVSCFQLTTLQAADHAVARALEEGMAKGMPYKSIYSLAKERVEGLAQILGKTPILLTLTSQKMIRTDAKC